MTKNVFEVVKIINFINSWFLNAHLFNILDVRMGNILKIIKVQSFLWGVNTYTIIWDSRWISYFFFFFFRASFLLERTISRKTVAIQTWVLVRHFLKNERSESVSTRKTAFAANYEIQAFKLKLEIWKSCICHWDLDSFAMLKDLSSGIGCDSNKWDFVILYNEMCQHLEALSNSLYYSKWPVIDVTESSMGRNMFNMQGRPVDFYIT